MPKLKLLLSYLVIFTLFVPNLYTSVKAAGINPVITPSAKNVSTAGSSSLAFVTNSSLAAGSDINLSYNSLYIGTLTTANTTVNSVAPTSIASSTTSGITTSVITLASSINKDANVTISTTSLTSPSTAGNYTFAIDASGNQSGAVLQYVGQANTVKITGIVPISLSMAIRNSTDTANTNTCNLGIMTTSTVNSCSYRIKAATNATSGYSVYVQTSGNFSNGSNFLNNAAAGNNGTGGTSCAVGTECYGVVVNKGNITSSNKGSAIALSSGFNAGTTNSVSINNTTNQVLAAATGPNSPTATDTANTILVTHNATINSSTSEGAYTQDVTYTLSPTF